MFEFRSKIQEVVDALEDDRAVCDLDVSGYHTKHITSRIFDHAYKLKRLNMANNKIKEFNKELQYLTK